MPTPAPNLVQQRCFHHPPREAVAQCPECARYFCRECVTEHEDRVICASCLQKRIGKTVDRSARFREGLIVLKVSAGVLVLWLLFYALGQALISIPSSFHEGTFWKDMSEIVNAS